jgi:hypothetical protein
MQSNPIFYHANNNIYIQRISTKFSNHCIIRKKLKERYTKIWREKINLVKQNPATNRNENKLRTYCKFKFIFQQEKYLDNIKELSNQTKE